MSIVPFNFLILKKYFDGFLDMPCDGTKSIVGQFNNYDKYIQYTIETEKYEVNGLKIPYLDTISSEPPGIPFCQIFTENQ